jgi:hypothetical protein
MSSDGIEPKKIIHRDHSFSLSFSLSQAREETMKVAMAAGYALLTIMNVHGEQVVAYVDNDNIVDKVVMREAQNIAKWMFAGVGVSIKWREGKPPRAPATAAAACLPPYLAPIHITVAPKTPKKALPRALAYAEIFPDSPGRIFVLADRLETGVWPGWMPTVLAHVLVHEITHVLEGVNRHAEKGVMKADWNHADYSKMASRPFEFTPADVLLIRHRLANPAQTCAEGQTATR